MDISIGELAKLTGISVKTIRYYADIGLVHATRRTAAGYRRYDEATLARLQLVRSLRDLGLDIDTTRRIAQRQASLGEVAAAQADTIDVHIRQLMVRRRVLRAIARGVARPEEVHRMTEFARASAGEVNRLMEDFIALVFADHEENPFLARMRAALPMLPEDPSDAQIDAWVELAGLVSDGAFRDRVRAMVVDGERRQAESGLTETDSATQAAGRAAVERGGAAVSSGIGPDSPEAAPVVDEVAGLFAQAAGRTDSPSYRGELASQLEQFSDRRVERYWQLIGVINGWPDQPTIVPAYE